MNQENWKIVYSNKKRRLVIELGDNFGVNSPQVVMQGGTPVTKKKADIHFINQKITTILQKVVPKVKDVPAS